MKVVVQLFAGARELAGRETLEVELPAMASVAELRMALQSALPELAPLLHHVLFAIDAQYAGDEAIIPADCEIACIPPVSGG